MSNIYIQEPRTNGKVVLETTVGEIEVELWPNEAPKACRNFVRHCYDGYYNNTIFHRVVRDFIVQGGDPTGTGNGGDSIYGKPFKDEFHSRLRFVRRGLVAMANAGKDDNGSQFFFTLASCPELQNKHTIFGKVVGDTIYNMLKLAEGLVGHDERPMYPHKIKSTMVLQNPFPDIVGSTDAATETVAREVTAKVTVKKNFKLLSFGDEAEEDEEETNVVAKEYRGKSKSSHDLANDPNLSSLPALPVEEPFSKKDSAKIRVDEANLEGIRKKLKKNTSETKKDSSLLKKTFEHEEEVEDKKKQTIDDIRREVKKLKKEVHENILRAKERSQRAAEDEKNDDKKAESETVELNKTFKSKELKKNSSREEKTLSLLAKFKTKLLSAKEGGEETESAASMAKESEVLEESDVGWLTHTLTFESHEREAKDANVKNEDTFEIYDPRNPINQRRREANKLSTKRK